MGFFASVRDVIKLQRVISDLQDTLRITDNSIRDVASEVKRLRMEWADHLDYTERAVGRWSKREQLDKKRAKDAEREAEPTDDLDQLIKDGRVSVGSYRNTS